MRGYLIFRVPTEVPQPSLGEAANPQVGPIGAEDAKAPTGFCISVFFSFSPPEFYLTS
jgi:hypothetical protein